MGVIKMPEWMMDYAASFKDDDNKIFREYRHLSEDYHREINQYNEKIYPVQNYNFKETNKRLGIDHGDLDPNIQLKEIDEKYKEKALNIACKYGYERPPDSVANHAEPLTRLQENSRFSAILKEDDKGLNLSHEDTIAKTAHKKYFEKHPKAKESHASRKADLRWLEEAEQVQDMLSVPYPEPPKVPEPNITPEDPIDPNAGTPQSNRGIDLELE